MTRNYRNDGSKFEGTRNFSSDQERINNKIKINNKMNELPNLVKDPGEILLHVTYLVHSLHLFRGQIDYFSEIDRWSLL